MQHQSAQWRHHFIQSYRNGSISSYSELAGFAPFKRRFETQKLIYYSAFYTAWGTCIWNEQNVLGVHLFSSSNDRFCLYWHIGNTVMELSKYWSLNSSTPAYSCPIPDIRNSILDLLSSVMRYAAVQSVEALRYKPEGRGFDSRWCNWNFSLTQSFRPHYGPGIDSASNRNEYQ